ncbi:MAG: hypothetical protein JSW62_03695 [Thermoplasmatales archaeon]|nr:MAG: hypothetical protein JSW62_03695 [Thermoplasmatales archaeon]
MKSAICTLFEGHYHFGVGVLVNSLYKNGFRGIVWAGYRGKLPPWAKPLRSCKEYKEFTIAEECIVRFIHLNTELHLTNYKASFMIDILNRYQKEVESIFYFDPDIVIKCPWSFYEKWISYGVALCQDNCYYNMPSNHPLKMAWKEFADNLGYKASRQLEYYINAGFIGLKKEDLQILLIWKRLLNELQKENINLIHLKAGRRNEKFHNPDQDMLNLTLMLTEQSLSVIGPEGMDFKPAGYTMSHAASPPKPWRKNYILRALNGEAPVLADKEYWKNTQWPIKLFSEQKLYYKKISLLFAIAIGRFIKRR